MLQHNYLDDIKKATMFIMKLNTSRRSMRIRIATMKIKKADPDEIKLPEVIVDAIYEYIAPSLVVRIAQGVNFLADVRRSYFNRSRVMSNRKEVTHDFVTQMRPNGAYCKGRFLVSIAFDQNYLKDDIKGDYRQPTVMEIRAQGRGARVFNYYELRSMVAPWRGWTRTQMCLRVAQDIVDYYDFCKSRPVVIRHGGNPLHMVDLEGHLEMVRSDEKPFFASKEDVVKCLMNARF